MKKLLLALAVLTLTASVYAQERATSVRGEAVPYKKTVLKGNEPGSVPTQVAPMTRDFNHNYGGSTYYDCQTNGSMANRVNAFNDGSVSWTYTTITTNLASRGTGYNYFQNEGYAYGMSGSSRIENVRTGWPTMTQVGDVEIVASHNGSNALVISICPEKGSGEWIYSELKGPELTHGTQKNTCLLWPSIASSGNTIHLLACTDQGDTNFKYNGIYVCVLYFRGTFNPADNTITWEEPRVVGDYTSSEVSSFGGDTYAIAAKNGTVAVVCNPNMRKDFFLWKSTDNGVTFTRSTIVESAMKDGTVAAMTDTTLYIHDGSSAVAIGDDGTVHVACGTFLTLAESDTSSTYSWYPSVGYLLYWNDTQEPIMYNNQKDYMDPEVLRSKGYTIIERENQDCDKSLWGVSGWTVNNITTGYGVGPVTMPQIVAQNGKVYVVYSQLMEFPFIDANSNKYFRGVFAAKSTNNGAEFGDVSWLSYNKNLYYLNSWELFPMDTVNPPSLADIRTYLDAESENVYPAVAPNLVNGTISMIWQTSEAAGSEIKEAPSENPIAITDKQSFMYFFQINADSIGIYNNVHEVCQGMWIDNYTGISNKVLSGMKIYPNPASNSVFVTFASEEADNALITVSNLMGQTVISTVEGVNEGNNKINLDINNLRSGVYVINVKTKNGTSTQKLIVK